MKLTRAQILDREFTRAPFPGLRRFSTGLITIARQLQIRFVSATPPLNEDGTAVDASKDMLLACFLLDESHELLDIRREVARGRAAVLAELEDYEFNLSPAKMRLASEEVSMTIEGVEAANFTIAPKPDDKGGAASPGNS